MICDVFFDENERFLMIFRWKLEQFDTPVCRFNFSRQMWFLMILKCKSMIFDSFSMKINDFWWFFMKINDFWWFFMKINDFWWFFDGFWLGFGRYWDRVVDILVFHFRKSASRGFEPTRDFGVLVTGFRQWWLPLRQRRGCGLRGAVRGELETDVGAPIPSILFSVSAFYAEPRVLVH